jgi:hypothetical protein
MPAPTLWPREALVVFGRTVRYEVVQTDLRATSLLGLCRLSTYPTTPAPIFTGHGARLCRSRLLLDILPLNAFVTLDRRYFGCSTKELDQILWLRRSATRPEEFTCGSKRSHLLRQGGGDELVQRNTIDLGEFGCSLLNRIGKFQRVRALAHFGSSFEYAPGHRVLRVDSKGGPPCVSTWASLIPHGPRRFAI